MLRPQLFQPNIYITPAAMVVEYVRREPGEIVIDFVRRG